MSRSRSRSTIPSRSGMVGARSFAESGRSSRPSRPLSRSMVRSVSRRWLFGRCPRTLKSSMVAWHVQLLVHASFARAPLFCRDALNRNRGFVQRLLAWKQKHPVGASIFLIGEDAVKQASVVAAGPGARVGLVINQNARRITVATRDADVIDNDHGRVACPLHLYRNRRDDVPLPVLNSGGDQPGVAGEFRDAQDGVFVFLLGSELSVFNGAPAPAQGGSSECGFEFRLQFLGAGFGPFRVCRSRSFLLTGVRAR